MPQPVAIPLIVWLLIQLGAIALAASRVPLSANYPDPPERLAVHVMVIVQFVGSTMFFPVLFRAGWRGWLGMVATAGPMLMLAAWLARMPMSRVLPVWVEVAMWLTTLALWRAALFARPSHHSHRSDRLLSVGFCELPRGVALLLSAGGLLFWYLHTEFQPVREPVLLRLFPLPAVLRNLTAPAADASPLLSTAALSAAALVILAAKWRFGRGKEPKNGHKIAQSATSK